MVKKTISLILAVACFHLFGVSVKANENFTTSLHSKYYIDQNGKTFVENKLTLINNTSETHAPAFIFTASNMDIEDVSVKEGDRDLTYSLTSDQENQSINIEFDNYVAGINKQREFLISYSTASLTTSTGNVWEVSIPKLPTINNIDTYNIEVRVPISMGNESYVSPQPSKKDLSDKEVAYYYDNDISENSSINIVFGDYQVFSFDINYRLENSTLKSDSMQIAIPQDTSTQVLYYDSISPSPVRILVNEDGNWLAEYNLQPKEKIDINIKGYAKLLSSPRVFLHPSEQYLQLNTKPTQYWQSNDPKIIQIARSLKSPENIYEYVVNTLTFNQSRVKPDIQRLGAIDTIKNSNNATSIEFSDLFIALCRAAGIPARQLIGFAYTENENVYPLSLVADVLHSWPEYWSVEKSRWVPVDPTWGSTSSVDYYNNLDLRHFAFVTHGVSDTYPIPPGSYKYGDNPQKDVFINVSTLPDHLKESVDINNKLSFSYLSSIAKAGFIIKNTGNSAVYNSQAKVFLNDYLYESFYINVLPPNAEYQIDIESKLGFMAKNAPDNIILRLGKHKSIVNISRNGLIISQLIVILSILIVFVITTASLIKLKKSKT